MFWISMCLFWIHVTLFYPTRIIGKKNLVKTKAIWAANHTSNMDALIIGTRIFRRFYSLAKAELFKKKLFAKYMKSLGAISVNRGASDIQAVKTTLRVLKEKNKPVLIFPTGTRESSPEEVQDLKNGVAMFALKANAPIVPIVVVRKPKIWRFNRVVVGEPIDVSKYQGQKAGKEVFDEINAELTKRMEELIEKYSYKRDKKKKIAKAV